MLVGASSPQSQELWIELRSMGSLQSDRTRRDRSLCGGPCGGPCSIGERFGETSDVSLIGVDC